MLVLSEYSYGCLNGILLLFVCCSSRNVCLQRSEKSSKPQVIRSPVVNCRFFGHTRTVAVLRVHSSEPSIQHYVNFLSNLQRLKLHILFLCCNLKQYIILVLLLQFV